MTIPWSPFLQNAGAALVVGALTGLTTYSATNSFKAAEIAGGTALLTYVASRLGITGAVNSVMSAKATKASTPSS
jgi:hypothetical protein